MNGGNNFYGNDVDTNELDNDFETQGGGPGLYGNGASGLTDKGVSGGAKAGIAIGVILLVMVAAGAIFYVVKRR